MFEKFYECTRCKEQPYNGLYCTACGNSGYADYAAVPCESCHGEPLLKRGFYERAVISLEKIVSQQEEIIKRLDVIAGAKTVSEIHHNIVPGSEVELFDGSKAVQVYCNNEFQAPMSLNRGSSLFYENTKND